MCTDDGEVFEYDGLVLDDLADAEGLPAGCDDPVEPGLPRGLDGEVSAVRGPGERARLARERPRDDPPDGVSAGQQAARKSGNLPQPFGRPDRFVRRDLEDRVARRVQDRATGREVFRSELVDDHGARGGLVAEHLPADVFLERADDLRRESRRIQRKRPLDDEAHHFPVARGCVLARGELVRLAARAAPSSVARRLEKSEEAERLEVGKRPGTAIQNVAERIRIRIAVGRGVGRRSDAQPVTDEDQDPSAGHLNPGFSVERQFDTESWDSR